jgi:hypothetical protein
MRVERRSSQTNGVTRLAGNAAFSYSGGQASWSWNNNQIFGFASIGSVTGCTVVHN